MREKKRKHLIVGLMKKRRKKIHDKMRNWYYQKRRILLLLDQVLAMGYLLILRNLFQFKKKLKIQDISLILKGASMQER